MFDLEVLETQHYTDRLFRFRVQRPDSFRFRTGEFVMIGLPGDNGKPILRAYSIASPAWDDTLEFYSIKVPDGPLTSKLQKIQPGDSISMAKKPTGTLVLDALTPAKNLWLISTGTGVAPFASLIRDPDVYEQFDRVILTHTCRGTAELAYSQQIVDETINHEFLGEMAREKLTYLSSTTQDADAPLRGRITALIDDATLFEQANTAAWTPENDRVMICGSLAMCKDVGERAEKFGLDEGSNSKPAAYVIEKAFVG